MGSEAIQRLGKQMAGNARILTVGLCRTIKNVGSD